MVVVDEIWEEDSLLPVMQWEKYRCLPFPIGMVQIVIVCYPVLSTNKKIIFIKHNGKVYFVQSTPSDKGIFL